MSVPQSAAVNLLPENSPACLDEIVQEAMPSVRFLASRLASRLPSHIDVEDLVQVGVIGLLQSADRFDAQRGAQFKTYANRRVQGAMLDYLRSLDWRPRSVRQRSRRVEQAHREAEQRLGRRATEEEIAGEIGISVTELEQWGMTFEIVSSSEQREEARSLEDLVASTVAADSPEEIVAKKQLQSVLVDAIDQLPETERLVLTLYYYEQLTMQEVGELLGVGQARVSQIHSQAILRLRKRLSPAASARESHQAPSRRRLARTRLSRLSRQPRFPRPTAALSVRRSRTA